MRRLLPIAALMVWCAPTATAQSGPPDDYPKLEVFAGYSAIRRTTSNVAMFGSFREREGLSSTTGFETSTIGNLSRWFGFKADFSAHFADARQQIMVGPACPTCMTTYARIHFRTRLVESLGGPEVKARGNSRWTPFAHALFGVAHASANFDATGQTIDFSEKVSNDAFAMAMGGGVDFRIATRISVRSSIDYNPVFFGGNDTVANRRQDFVRFSIGLLFH